MREKQIRSMHWVVWVGMSALLAGCSMPIQHGLTERDANQILVLLAKSNPPISATKVKDESGREVRWTIVVPKSEATRAIGILRANNLPRKPEKGFADIYGKSGMIPTATEERAKFLMALKGELRLTLRKIIGVLDADVHLVIPQEKILRRPGEKQPWPRASVLLLVKSDVFNTGTKRMKLRSDVQRLVAGSLERLKENRVSVIIRDGDMTVSTGESAETTGGNYKSVLMIRVAPSDARKLQMILLVMMLLLGLFLILTLVFFFRSASLKNQLKVSNNSFTAT